MCGGRAWMLVDERGRSGDGTERGKKKAFKVQESGAHIYLVSAIGLLLEEGECFQLCPRAYHG
jgi:hypothetical protein